MKFTIVKEDLVQPLRKLGGIVSTSDLVSALAYVRIEPSANGVTFTATDQNLSLTFPVPVEGENLKSCTVPAEKLAQICTKLPPGANIRFELEEGAEKMIFHSGKSRYSLQTIDPDRVPPMESQEEELQVLIPEKDLQEMVHQVSYAMARNDVRYFLLGMLLEVDIEKISAVATDGHRMAATYCEQPTGAEEARSIIVPEKAIDELAKNLESREESLTVKLTSNYLEVVFSDDRVIFKTTLVEGKFPDYQSVIPKSRETNITVPRVEMIAALDRLLPISTDIKARQSGNVTMALEKGLTMQASNSAGDRGEEPFDVPYEGEPMRVTLNIRYLLDALNHMGGDEATIGIRDPATSVLITEPENAAPKHIIMPIRDTSGGDPGAAGSS